MQRRINFLFLITFLVALCSIVYEVAFAQLLSLVFGYTVFMYSITIGLFLFSMGVGALLFSKINKCSFKKISIVFVTVELLIVFFALLGLFLIGWLARFVGIYDSVFISTALMIAGFIPIFVIGLISGLELPILTRMYDKEDGYAHILGVDYFGSLIGTTLFALVMYPYLGIFNTFVVVAFINTFVAFIFALQYNILDKFLWIFAILFFAFSFYAMAHTRLQQQFDRWYFESVLESIYKKFGFSEAQVSVDKTLTSAYQTAVWYTIFFSNNKTNSDQCLNLDRDIQACANWVESYHKGLIYVPMSMINKENLHVLVLGGGDFIVVNFLKKFDSQIARIDLVDIDKKFREEAKQDTFLRQYHQDSYKYDKLTVFNKDALHFLRTNKKKYDLILVDLPGAKHEKLLPLYSVEFFKLIKRALDNDGLVVSWFYPKKGFNEHAQVLEATLYKAGFGRRFDYVAYNYPTEQKTEQFFVLRNDNSAKEPLINTNSNSYVKYYADKYTSNSWYTIAPKNGIEPHSIFKPNYDVLVR